MSPTPNPIQPFLEEFGYLILDGGLATELEKKGYDLADKLWSARLLLDDPAAIRQLHLDYFGAGADCAITASYQATFAGLMQRGLNEPEAAALLRLSVRLAIEARDQFWAQLANRVGRLRPLVAASVGPYGAALANGAEYTGVYDLDEAGLMAFHRRRWHILAESDADLMACETIPSAIEGRALLRLLAETPARHAWFSFSCRDGRRLNDGSLLAESVALVSQSAQVVAVGVNCTAPSYIPSLIAEARRASEKPIVIYPNSGESYDEEQRRWIGRLSPDLGATDFAAACAGWRADGASLIGGCCRTGPEHIRRICQLLRARE